MISNLTKEKRNQVIKKLKKLTGFKVVQSRTLLQRIANYFKLRGAKKLLLEMGVEKADEFLAKRFIYMPIGKKHYLFAPRSLTEGTVGQFMDNVVTLAHEFDHKLRFGKDGPIQYRRRYIGNKWDRADYEGSAYGAGADIDWKFGRNARLSADDIFDEDFERMYILDIRHASAAKAVFRKVAENRPQRFGTEAGARVWAVVEEVLEG